MIDVERQRRLSREKTARYRARRRGVDVPHLPLGRRQRSLAERFWEKVDVGGPDECWEWTASVTLYGYGCIGRGRGSDGLGLAHRVAWELEHGPIPEGIFVCHRCDRPSCCNVAHLFLGTARHNTLDMMAKGRHRTMRGDDCPRRKVSSADVKLMREEWDEWRGFGVTTGELATIWGLSTVQMRRILQRKSWAHVA